MKPIGILAENRFGITVVKDGRSCSIYEEYHNGNLTVKTPLGELLFTAVEAIEYFNEKYINASACDEIHELDNFFIDKEYDLSHVFSDFCIDILEIKRLTKIKDFLTLCSGSKHMCNTAYVKDLAIAVLPRDNPLFNLFGENSRYNIRHIHSNIKLPFGLSIKQTIQALEEQYSEFTFSTQTNVNSITELCVLSLYEIFESGQFVRRCSNCNGFFATERETGLCTRPNRYNDYRGCRSFKSFLYNKNYSSDVVKEYRKIYNRLRKRTQKKKLSDINKLDEFKKEWIALNKRIKNHPKKEEFQSEFLSSSRWD